MDVQVRTLAEKSCNDCHTTTTPLWRAGPDGPRSLCNACGLRYRKRRKAMLGLGKGGPKKSKKRNRTRRGHEVGVPLNKALIDFGRKMDQPYNLHERQCNLKDEEEAAILLMALSCGSLCAFTN